MKGKFSATTLAVQIERTIQFWCRFNARKRDSDLETACWAKVVVPKTLATLERTWQDQDHQRGGTIGVSKFVSIICRNVWRDHLRSRSANSRIPSSLLIRLSDPIPSHNSDDPESEENLADAVTGDEGGGYQVFFVSDLRGNLAPEEFSLVESILAGQSIREFAAQYSYSKSSAGRIRDRVVTKVERHIDGIRQKPRPIITPIPLSGRSSYRPDQISKENLESFAAGPNVVPFTVCEHATGNGDMFQNFALAGAAVPTGRFALCRQCWQFYWRSLCEKMGADIERLELELLASEA